MTTEDNPPRRRRRRKRRGGSSAESDGSPKPEDSQGDAQRRRKRPRRKRKGRAPSTTQQQPLQITGEPERVHGVLWTKPNGQSILLDTHNNYVPQPSDPQVPRSIIDKLRLDDGILIEGMANQTTRGLVLDEVEKIEGRSIEDYQEQRHPFADLISIDPTEQFKLETESQRLTTRVLDLLVPIGKGQRCLVVAPPKAGKTTLLKDIAHGIETNHPEVIVLVLLVDERPEEVTDMRRSVQGDVIASSSDETAENHITIAEVVLERARRLVELKEDVVILCDSITRMSRAYNNQQKGSGRIMSGGIDARTMEKPRRFFGAARKAENWGSLTIVATALVDTGSRMDEIIFQEFKGTGNTEIVLERGLFERRIFPAMNIPQSGTRKEEKLIDPAVLPKIHQLRRALAGTDPLNAMRMLLEKLQKFDSNDEFLQSF